MVIQSFFSGYLFQVRDSKGVSVVRAITARVLQGFTIFPLLFNFFSSGIHSYPRAMTDIHANYIALFNSDEVIARVVFPLQDYLGSLRSRRFGDSKSSRPNQSPTVEGLPGSQESKTFIKGLSWCKQIRSKTLGAFIQPKSFFNNRKV